MCHVSRIFKSCILKSLFLFFFCLLRSCYFSAHRKLYSLAMKPYFFNCCKFFSLATKLPFFKRCKFFTRYEAALFQTLQNSFHSLRSRIFQLVATLSLATKLPFSAAANSFHSLRSCTFSNAAKFFSIATKPYFFQLLQILFLLQSTIFSIC